MSKECEYCFKQHKRHEYIAEDGDTTASLKIDKDMLFIELKWYDELRKTYLGMGMSPMIRYCPWCGRKLEENED